VIAAGAHRVPAPFRAFAVRSEEARHAGQARAPCGWVHRVRTDWLHADARARIAALGWSRLAPPAFPDINHARTTLAELATAAPQVPDWAASLAGALQQTGVLGSGLSSYRRSLATRIDFLGARGAGFHNDVSRHWSACLFWVLALQLADVEFVMPHAGLRLVLAPGDLLVFDPTMAHGLCRPHDHGQALASSFEGAADSPQIFLTGELRLADAQWAALGAPWLPLADHEHRGALDLLVASFDERSGAIQRLQALRGRMRAATG
jgi:hypothetical protein